MTHRDYRPERPSWRASSAPRLPGLPQAYLGSARSRRPELSGPAPEGSGSPWRRAGQPRCASAPGSGGRPGSPPDSVSEAWRRRRCCFSSPSPQAPSPASSAHARSLLGERRWWLSAPAAACPRRLDAASPAPAPRQ